MMLNKSSKAAAVSRGPDMIVNLCRARSYESKFALYGCISTFMALFLVSSLCALNDGRWPHQSRHHSRSRRQRWLLEKRTASASITIPCGDIYLEAQAELRREDREGDEWRYSLELCEFSLQCEGSWPSRHLLPLLLCHGMGSGDETVNDVTASPSPLLPPLLTSLPLPALLLLILVPTALLLFLAFRLLATTAEGYFSPALETLSKELRLPPRFAGATLLALGNGSPDLGATINAVLLWHDSNASNAVVGRSSAGEEDHAGWSMSLGSLCGGGMFVGTVVSGLIVRSCHGVSCRFSLIRDVAMYAISVLAVWTVFSTGRMTARNAMSFLCLYGVYVSVVLVADLYYRNVTRKHIRTNMIAEAINCDNENNTNNDTTIGNNHAPGDQHNRTIVNEASSLANSCNHPSSYYNSLKSIHEHHSNRHDTRHDNTNNVHGRTTVEQNSNNHHPAAPKLPTSDRIMMFFSNYDPSSAWCLTHSSRLSSRSSDDANSRLSSRSSDDVNDNCNELNTICRVKEKRKDNMQHPNRLKQMESEKLEVDTESPPNLMVYQNDKNNHHDNGGNCHLLSQFTTNEMETNENHTQSICNSIHSCSKHCSLSQFPRHQEEQTISSLFVNTHHKLLLLCKQYWNKYFHEEMSCFERSSRFLELPFTLLRSATIPIPCRDHYCKSRLALSIALSPYWLLWYFEAKWYSVLTVVLCSVGMVLSLSVLIYAKDDGVPLVALVPLSLYGFFIAATWIDVIAKMHVGILEFLGIVSHIPGPILGMTILAWGNSMGDLSANIAMARKGMPDMATTGCFAGPSFNLLVGIGSGFLRLLHTLNLGVISPLSLSPSIKVGFVFIIMNCIIAIVGGIACGWRIPYQHSYVFFSLYALFLLFSTRTLFEK